MNATKGKPDCPSNNTQHSTLNTQRSTLNPQHSTMNTTFTFSAGVWNLNTGADPFGPAVRPEREFVEKAAIFKRLGFDYVQLHDDDAVPMDVPPHQTEA